MASSREELSVFVDESGSFDSSLVPSRFYIVTLLFHDQSEDIAPQLRELDMQLEFLGLPELCIHSGPLIRREEMFREFDLVLRRKIFSRMVAFTRKVPISYRSFAIDKRAYTTPIAMMGGLASRIAAFLAGDGAWIADYKRLKIYYDNGQRQVKSILSETFSGLPVNFHASVTPERYRLFQAADLLCSIELLRMKIDNGIKFTKSEATFFRSIRDFRKTVLRPLERLIK